jgi:phage terminase large subunit-like protein
MPHQKNNPTRARPEVDPRLDAYVDGVVQGTIVVGRLTRLAIQRFLADLARAEDANWGYHIDRDEARFAIAFVERLRHSTGEWAGQQLVLSPWQVFIAAMLFGWKKTDGSRRFRIAYIEVGRKNGKSTFASAIGLKLFVADGEQGAQVYTCATKLAQAKIVHEESKRMVRRCPALRKIVDICRDCLSILATNSIYKPLGKDGGTEDGLSVSGAIVDELHAHPNRELFDVIDTATGARRNPLILLITTAGDGNEREGICWELRTYTIKVLEGIVADETWFGVIYALDEATFDGEGDALLPEDDWTDERVWPKANPNLGVSVKLDDLQRKAARAVETPAAQVNFRRKHLNQWLGSLKSWLPPALWQANSGAEAWYGREGLLPEIRDRYRGRPCWVGMDLASVEDLTGAVFVFKSDDGYLDLFPFCWCPKESALRRAQNKRAPYLIWERQRQIFLTDGDSVDYDAIRALLREARDAWGWDVAEIACDPWNARQILTKLHDDDDFRVFEHRQGFVSMNDPMKQTQKALLDRKIRHGGHQALAWCVSNVVTESDHAGNLKMNKEKSAEKIDLACAAVMGIGRALLDDGPSDSQLIVV